MRDVKAGLHASVSEQRTVAIWSKNCSMNEEKIYETQDELSPNSSHAIELAEHFRWKEVVYQPLFIPLGTLFSSHRLIVGYGTRMKLPHALLNHFHDYFSYRYS